MDGVVGALARLHDVVEKMDERKLYEEYAAQPVTYELQSACGLMPPSDVERILQIARAQPTWTSADLRKKIHAAFPNVRWAVQQMGIVILSPKAFAMYGTNVDTDLEATSNIVIFRKDPKALSHTTIFITAFSEEPVNPPRAPSGIVKVKHLKK